MIQTVSYVNPSPMVVAKLRLGDAETLKRIERGDRPYQFMDMDMKPGCFDHILYHVNEKDQLYQTLCWEQVLPVVGKVQLHSTRLINAAGLVPCTREGYAYACKVRFNRQLHFGPDGGLLTLLVRPGADICLDFETT